MKDDSTLISEVLEKIPNKYMAVIVASKRARAINDGQRPLIKAGNSKSTTIALAEIAEGVIVLAEAPEMEAAKKATAPEPETPEIEAEGEAKEEEKDKEEKKEEEEKQLLPSSDDSPETDKQDEQAEEDKQE